MNMDYIIVSLDGKEYRLPLNRSVTRYDAFVLFLNEMVQARKGNKATTQTVTFAFADEDDLVLRRRRR